MKAEIINSGRYTQVFIDGVEIHRVVSLELRESVDKAPTLLLEILPEEIDCKVDCEVRIQTLAEKEKLKEGYKDFIKFLFGNKPS